MLSHLYIRNLAIVDQLSLDLAPGMSVITGETGAGKSILVDALNLLLGDRADSDTVREDAEHAEIGAIFDLGDLPEARAWLAERDLGGDAADCHLRRTIGRQGRSRAFINGSPQALQALKELGELLVDIHGQHEHQSLLKHDLQRRLLDDYAGSEALLRELSRCYQEWQRLRQSLATLRQADKEREARQDWLNYQLRELASLNLKAGELTELRLEHQRLANAGRLLDSCRRIVGGLYEDELSVESLLTQTQRELHLLCTLDSQLAPAGEMLDAALIQVREAGDQLRRYLHNLELDPARLERTEQRLAAIEALARKHRIPAEELPELRDRLQREFAELDNSEQRLVELDRLITEHFQAYSHCAAELSARRAVAAAELSRAVSDSMAGLGMPGGCFEVSLERHDKPSSTGAETVEFMVSANPGQAPRPLSKVASGGELSRISLAIQVNAARTTRTPTLIFDEVDTGIGGGVAEMVGRQLRMLGRSHQVLCVTHLAQVAVQAHHQFRVRKLSDGRTTHTRIAFLNRDERITEIARMLGGLTITSNTLSHAEEMLNAVPDDG